MIEYLWSLPRGESSFITPGSSRSCSAASRSRVLLTSPEFSVKLPPAQGAGSGRRPTYRARRANRKFEAANARRVPILCRRTRASMRAANYASDSRSLTREPCSSRPTATGRTAPGGVGPSRNAHPVEIEEAPFRDIGDPLHPRAFGDHRRRRQLRSWSCESSSSRHLARAAQPTRLYIKRLLLFEPRATPRASPTEWTERI